MTQFTDNTFRFPRFGVARSLAIAFALLASGGAFAGKPTATEPLFVDAEFSQAGVNIDLDTGDVCTINSPSGNSCPNAELVVYFGANVGIMAWGSPLFSGADVKVGTLRGMRFDEVDADLAAIMPVKFTRYYISNLKFNDTLLVDAGGAMYKVGFFECHRPAFNYGDDMNCVETSAGDTEDDGGPGGDEGLRMLVEPLF